MLLTNGMPKLQFFSLIPKKGAYAGLAEIGDAPFLRRAFIEYRGGSGVDRFGKR